ncbi:MAG TPA: glycosyltransferase family 1 protein [Anaeromyxobacteraceae bacterium]|nr:glycosyltransferase family 1 protein [Anaeromyxobacteraceae bacterium]
MSAARVCVDLTPLEIRERHGGIGRYALHLLEELVALPAGERGGVEVLAALDSDGAPLPGEAALERARRLGEIMPAGRHRAQRRFALSRRIREARVDLFHATEAAALPLRPGCPVVSTCYDVIPLVVPKRGGPVAWWQRERLRLALRLRYRRAARIIAISAVTGSDLCREVGVDPGRVEVVHLGVDGREFSAGPASPDERERTRARHALPERWFVYVGSDHYRKNHARLFEAWCRVADRLPEGLVLVGRALYASTLQRIEGQARARGLSSRVRWLSGLEDEALPPLYRHATAAVIPALYEGFGMTILEAMACGTPVAASRNGAHEEVAGEDAAWFDPRSVDDMAAALVRLSSDAALRARLRDRGLARAGRTSWARTARETLAVYRRVLAGRGGP